MFGGLALTNLKQELIPSLELPALVVMTTYPGASPEVVENDVSTPIESAIQGVPGLESTTATSTTNASIVQAMFAYGTTNLGHRRAEDPAGDQPRLLAAAGRRDPRRCCPSPSTISR